MAVIDPSDGSHAGAYLRLRVVCCWDRSRFPDRHGGSSKFTGYGRDSSAEEGRVGRQASRNWKEQPVIGSSEVLEKGKFNEQYSGEYGRDISSKGEASTCSE